MRMAVAVWISGRMVCSLTWQCYFLLDFPIFKLTLRLGLAAELDFKALTALTASPRLLCGSLQTALCIVDGSASLHMTAEALPQVLVHSLMASGYGTHHPSLQMAGRSEEPLEPLAQKLNMQPAVPHLCCMSKNSEIAFSASSVLMLKRGFPAPVSCSAVVLCMGLSTQPSSFSPVLAVAGLGAGNRSAVLSMLPAFCGCGPNDGQLPSCTTSLPRGSFSRSLLSIKGVSFRPAPRCLQPAGPRVSQLGHPCVDRWRFYPLHDRCLLAPDPKRP